MNGFVRATREHRILLLGHQGVYGELPANSLSGFKRAIDMGLDGIETNLHATKDGRIVLMHDDDVTATTLSEGRLTQMTFEEVSKLNVAEKFRLGFGFEPVPTLNELLEMAKPVPGFLLNLELKDYPEMMGDTAYRTIDGIVRLVEEAGMGERVVFCSRSCAALRYVVGEYCGRYPIESVYPSYVMIGDFGEDIYEHSLYAAVINVKVREDGSRDWLEAQRKPLLPHEKMTELKSYGMCPCICCSPWDTEEIIGRAVEEGIEMIIANYPSNTKRIFEQLKLR
ncbi:MAG: hypothetical protein IKI24_01145 [Clostridia bacterium]|nr:hypothetical protein [Clostridia bacterium]